MMLAGDNNLGRAVTGIIEVWAYGTPVPKPKWAARTAGKRTTGTGVEECSWSSPAIW